MSNVFKASWDKWVWIFSVIFIGLLGVLPIGMIAYALTTPHADQRTLAGVAVLLLVILAVVYLFSPQAYAVEPGELIIQRPGTDVAIPLKTIERIEVGGGWQVFRGALRLFASGGAFGFYGSFWSSTLKNFTAYATRMDKVVVLYRTTGGPIVVSPDEIEAFVAAIREAKRWR